MTQNRPPSRTQRAPEQTGRDSVEERPAPIGAPSWGHIGIIVQSFAVFVAISTLLGRIYSLTYFETLGIPVSEISLNVTDYAVVSPDVTIFGVGFSVITAILLWSGGSEALKAFPRRARVLLGLVCCLGAILIPTYAVIYLSRQPDLDSVWLTIQMLLAFALASFGGSILSSAFSSDAPRKNHEIALSKAFMPLLIILVLGIGVWTASEFSSIMGEVDARITAATAPQASIELASSNEHDALPYGQVECGSSSLGCLFRVVLISDTFVYLRPLDPESPEDRLYAVPIGDIASINYIFEGNAP